MPRTSPLTEQELVKAAAKLRRLCDVDAYGRVVQEVFNEVCGARQSYYFHFLDGRLNLQAHNLDCTKEEYLDFLEERRPFDPGDVYRRKAFVHHVAELYNWDRGRKEELADAYRTLWGRLGTHYMVGVHVFEDEVLACNCGPTRTFADGDFTSHDIEALELIYPHLAEGFRQAAAWTRQQRFGDAMAVAVEDHPRPLFLFDGAGDMRYANREARMVMQREREKGGLPMAEQSETVKALRPWVRDEPGHGPPPGWSIHRLPAWPRLGVNQPVLIMGAVGALPEIPLSAREREVLQTMAGRNVEEAAEQLRLSPHTVRTHLKRIYRKLDVSGLGEALTRYEMSAK